MRLRYLAAILFGIAGGGPAFAGDSITNKAQGSTGWSMDFGLDATTSNIRPLAILVDPTTGLLVPPFQAGNSIGNTSFIATQATAANLNALVAQGAAASSGPWIVAPWIGGAVNSATNGLYFNLLQGNAVVAAGNPIFATIEGVVPLPTGAATAANQEVTLAGTSATSAQGVQGVTGGVALPISGTVTANAGTNLNTSLLALESGGNLATIAGAITASVEQTNEKQINGVVPLMGNGISGTGSQRVNIASDNTAFSVNAIESGTWNITNISGTVSLPTGASTSALQPTNAAQGSTTSGQTGTLMEGAVTTAAPSYTTAQTSPFSLDTAGNLRVNVVAGGGSGGTSSSFSATFPGTGTAAGAEYLSSPPTLTTGQMVAFQTDVNGNLKVNVAAGGAAGGTSSSFAATFPATGTAAGLEYLSSPPTLTTGQMGAFQGDINGNLKVNLQTAIPAGANVIGAVTESGAWTVTANAGTNLNTSLLALESGGNLATIAGAISSAVEQSNTKQINGIAPLMGNGVSGTGSQRVNIASDNTAFTVNAAESGSWTVTANAGTNLNTSLLATAANQEVTAAGTTATSAQGVQGVTGGVPLPTSGIDTTTASTAISNGTTNSTISVSLAGQRGAVFQLQSAGTLVAVVTPQCSYDGGTIYNTNGSIVDPISGVTSLTATIASAQATTDYPVLCPSGASNVQIKATTYTSGSANWLARATANSPIAVSYGTDGTNIRALTMTTWGSAPSAVPVQDVNANIVAGGITGFAAGGTFSGSNGVMVGGEVTGGSLWQPFQLDSSKDLLVNVAASNNTSLAGTTLGSPSNYGTSPGAVEVPGVNAFVTNTPSVVSIAGTTGGATAGNEIAPNNTTGINLKASAGTVYGIQIGGIGAAPAYLKLYNKATAPTCGTDTPIKRIVIPSNSTAGSGSNISFPIGIAFGTGIGYCVTTGITDADTTAPAASTFLVNIDWN